MVPVHLGVPGTVGKHRTQATEWGELAHAFPANQHRLCSLHALPTIPCPAHHLRRSCRAPGPAPDLLPALWLQTHPLQTQAGICCQPVSSREAYPARKRHVTTQIITLACGLAQLWVRDCAPSCPGRVALPGHTLPAIN